MVETEHIEHKESLAERDDAGADLVALANAGGGTIYFGRKNNGDVVGIKDANEETVRNLCNFFVDNTDPRLYPSIEKKRMSGFDVLVVKIGKSPTPYHTFRGRAYVRVGSTSKKMSAEELQSRMRNYGGQRDYSSDQIKGSSILDLSKQAIRELRRLLKQSGRFNKNIERATDRQLLKDLRLLSGDSVTVAALILLGSESSVKKYLPYVEVRYGFKNSAKDLRFADMEIFGGGYLLNYKKIWEKINARNTTLTFPAGMRLVGRQAFEESTIREAINNAVIHRDYSVAESAFIEQNPEQVVVKSPGGFPPGVTVENIGEESKPRNKLIADTLFKCEFVEQFGTGVNLMIKNQLELGKNPPNYAQSNERHVILELDGSIQDVQFARYVFEVADMHEKELNDRELLVLAKIKNTKHRFKPDDKDQVMIKNLLDLGLIERMGYNRYILSKQYYSDTGKTGEYTRQKGLSRAKNKELILQHLSDFGGDTKRGIMKIFSFELTVGQVQSLITELKDEGKISFIGKRRSPSGKWKLTVGLRTRI